MVVFGFSPDSYSVLESAGSVDLGVLFVSGSFGAASISVQLPFMTSSGTAQGGHEGEGGRGLGGRGRVFVVLK